MKILVILLGIFMITGSIAEADAQCRIYKKSGSSYQEVGRINGSNSTSYSGQIGWIFKGTGNYPQHVGKVESSSTNYSGKKGWIYKGTGNYPTHIGSTESWNSNYSGKRGRVYKGTGNYPQHIGKVESYSSNHSGKRGWVYRGTGSYPVQIGKVELGPGCDEYYGLAGGAALLLGLLD